jgi:hypothetical protein
MHGAPDAVPAAAGAVTVVDAPPCSPDGGRSADPPSACRGGASTTITVAASTVAVVAPRTAGAGPRLTPAAERPPIHDRGRARCDRRAARSPSTRPGSCAGMPGPAVPALRRRPIHPVCAGPEWVGPGWVGHRRCRPDDGGRCTPATRRRDVGRSATVWATPGRIDHRQQPATLSTARPTTRLEAHPDTRRPPGQLPSGK